MSDEPPADDRRTSARNEAELQDVYLQTALLDEQQAHPRMLLSRVHVRLGGRFFSVWWAIPLLGFKHVKWISEIEFVRHFSERYAGYGGYQEDHEFFGYHDQI